MKIVEDLYSVSKTLGVQYGVRNVPETLSNIDVRINDIIDDYLQLGNQEKSNVESAITSEIAWLLLCFAIRMATYSLRFSSQRYVTNGLQALGMTIGVLDEREVLVVLVLYSDAKGKTGLSFKSVLERESVFSTLLENFISRSEHDKSLSSMGYVLKADEKNNLTYIRTW